MTVVQLHDARSGGGDRLVVRGGNDRHVVTLSQFRQQRDNLFTRFEVKVPRRFIAEENRGIVKQGSCKGNSLAFPAGEGRRTAARITCQANDLEELLGTSVDPRPVTPPLTSGEECRQSDILTTGQMIEQVVGLKDMTDDSVSEVRQIVVSEGLQASPGHLDDTLEAPIQPANEVEQGRLARARTPDHRHEIPILDLEVDTLQYVDVGPRVSLADILEPNHERKCSADMNFEF